MRGPDDVPVNGKPAQEGAGESDECELELGDDAQLAAPDVDSSDDGERADDDGEHSDAILKHKPLEPCRSGRHEVVALYREIAEQRAEKNDPDEGRHAWRRREPDGSGLRLGTGAPALEEAPPGSNEAREHDECKHANTRPKR